MVDVKNMFKKKGLPGRPKALGLKITKAPRPDKIEAKKGIVTALVDHEGYIFVTLDKYDYFSNPVLLLQPEELKDLLVVLEAIKNELEK